MAEEIRQVISIDTSGAIKSVQNLGKTLGTLGKGMGEFAGQLGKLGKASGNLNLKKTADEFNRLAKAMSKLKGAGGGSGLRQVAQDARQVKLTGAEAAAAMDRLLGITNKPIKQGAFARLSTVLTRVKAQAAQSGGAFQRFATFVKNGGRIIRAGAGDARRGLEGVLQAAQKVGNRGKSLFAPLISSFKNFGRVVATQTIVAAFSKLRQAIRDSIADNIKFVRSIQEVGTILPETGTNMEQLQAQVRELSDTLNVPLDKAAEGLYQAVSNQIGTAAESLQFLETAAKFAKGAVTDVDTSVKLLSGALNAFGEDAIYAETYAAQFFATIKLGRTRASELAQSFGRVAPIASELGISFAELNAAFATTTISGISTSESATQIRGALNALLKPTEATKELLRELGFASGEALVQARGLQGAMQALRDAAGGSITELSKFVPRVRGINFALLSTSEKGAKKFQENLKEIETTLASVAQGKYEFIVQTNAETVAKEAQQIKNFFTVDIGEALVGALADLSKMIGGFENFKGVLKGLIPVLAAGAGLAALYGTVLSVAMVPGLIKAAAKAKLLTIQMGILNKTFVYAAALIAAYFAAKYITNAIVNQVTKVNDAIDEQTSERVKAAERAGAAAVQFEELQSQKVRAAVTERIAEYNRESSEKIKATEKAAKVAIDKEDEIVAAIVNAAEKRVQATNDAAKNAEKVREKALENAKSGEAELSDFRFERENKRFNDLQKISRLQQRSQELARQAAAEFRAAGTDEKKLDQARATFDRAQAAADEALGLADALKNRGAIYQTEKNSFSILQRKVDLENKVAKLAKQEQAAQEAKSKAQQAELKGIREAAKAIADAPDLFDSKGRLKTGDELKEAQEARSKALLDFKKSVLSAESLDIEDLIEVSQLETSIEKQLTGVELQDFFVADAAKAARDEIQSYFKDFRLEFQDLGDALESTLGLDPGTLKTAEDFNQALAKTGELEKAVNTELAKQEVDRAKIIGDIEKMAQASGTNVSGAITNIISNLRQFAGDDRTTAQVQNLIGLMKQFRDINYDLRAGRQITQGQFAWVEHYIEKLQEAREGSGDWVNVLKDLGLNLDQIAVLQGTEGFFGAVESQVKQRARVEALLQKFPDDVGTLDEAREKLANLRAVTDPIAAGMGVMRENMEAMSQLGPPTGYEAFAQRVLQAEKPAESLNDSLSNISTLDFKNLDALKDLPSSVDINVGGGPESRLGGRVQYRRKGGPLSRGTDTVPAMLSPGEFVVNARSTRRFFSQLQAINAGRSPVYRAEGGPVPQQTNIGDINVNVSDSGGAPDQTGRQIARSLRRELRRNTSQL